MQLEQLTYPIQGPGRELTLTMEWLIIFLCLELAILFYIRINKKERSIRSQQERAFIMLFLGYAIMWFFLILGDYYAETLNEQLILINIGAFLRFGCGSLFFYRIEKHSETFKRFLFTKISILVIGIILVIFIFSIELSQSISAYLYWAIINTFFVLYLVRIRSSRQIKKMPIRFKRIILVSVLGFALLFCGYLISRVPLLIPLTISVRFVGDVCQIVGLVFLAFFFISVPSLTEYTWSDKLTHLYVILKTGVCIYYKSFKKEKQKIDEQIASGAIKSINDMLQELTDNKGSSIIEKKGSIFIIQQGKLIYGVLICKEELTSLKFLLSSFIEKVESIYKGVLEKWDSEMKIFEPIDDIVKEIFY